MNLWKLSLTYLKRQKMKTVTLFLVFLTIGTCLISLMSIQHSLEKNILTKQGKSIYLTSKEKAYWPEQAYEALKKAKMVESVEASLSADVGSSLKTVSSYASSKEEKQVTLTGYQNTEGLRAFQTRTLILKQGTHLAADNTKQVLVPLKLAKKNHLNVGDKLRLGKQNVIIAGIYKANDSKSKNIFNPDLDNTLLAQETLVKKITKQKGYQTIVVRLSDKRLVDTVVQNIKQWPLDFGKLDVQTAKEFYGDSYNNIETLHRLVGRIIFIVSLVSMAILVVMLTFWINNRIKETGILLAIGKTKFEIIGHYLIEVLLVAGVAFALSIFGGVFLGKTFAAGLLSQVNGGVSSQIVQNNSLIIDRIDSLAVSVGVVDVFRLYVQGALICLFAVVLSSYS
ncbi:ABC transporter permease, partial [Streptococcus agalactiae]|nr:ABC transporter permease [Streptococcus agalactiae]